MEDPTADTNPADDQPTWTVDNEGRPQWHDFTGRDDWVLEADDLTYQLWTGCTTTEAAYAALVRAVEQARLLPAALDVIWHYDEGWVWDDVDACWRRGTWGAGETDPADGDAVRAVLQLVKPLREGSG